MEEIFLQFQRKINFTFHLPMHTQWLWYKDSWCTYEYQYSCVNMCTQYTCACNSVWKTLQDTPVLGTLENASINSTLLTSLNVSWLNLYSHDKCFVLFPALLVPESTSVFLSCEPKTYTESTYFWKNKPIQDIPMKAKYDWNVIKFIAKILKVCNSHILG